MDSCGDTHSKLNDLLILQEIANVIYCIVSSFSTALFSPKKLFQSRVLQI